MRQMDILISYVLRTGLWLSVIIVSIGGALYLVQNGSELIHYHTLEHEPEVTVLMILYELRTLTAEGIISLGLFILVLTQVARVILTVIIFIAERDTIFALISLWILTALIYSIFWRG